MVNEIRNLFSGFDVLSTRSSPQIRWKQESTPLTVIRVLSIAQLSAFARDGYLVLPGVVDGGRCASAVARVEQLLQSARLRHLRLRRFMMLRDPFAEIATHERHSLSQSEQLPVRKRRNELLLIGNCVKDKWTVHHDVHVRA